MAKINIYENILFFEKEIESNKNFSPEVKKRLREHNEAIQILFNELKQEDLDNIL